MRKPKSNNELNIVGKLPPQAIEVERELLGAMMIYTDSFLLTSGILNANDFYTESHKLIFQAITDLYNCNRTVDGLTVIQQLKHEKRIDEAGGGYYINQLTSNIPSSGAIEHYSFIIKQKSIQRRLIECCLETLNTAYEETEDALQLVSTHSIKIENVGISDVNSEKVDAASRMKNTIESIVKGRNNSGVTGVPSGILDIDRFTGGFQRGDLIFIGARPGNYKTGLIMAFAHKMVHLGFTPFIAQQEMAEKQSGMRELAMYSGISTEDLRRGQVTDSEMVQLEQAAKEISKLNVFIDHTGGLNLNQIRSKLKKQTKIKKIDILFIDYLQLLELETGSKGATDESLIAKTTRKMKLMAKELNIPIVALSQLNRQVENRDNKKPNMADLKGSGAIEADADIVILLYNATKYFPDAVDEQGRSLANKVELIFCKNRQGRTGSLIINVDPATNRFNEIETEKTYF